MKFQNKWLIALVFALGLIAVYFSIRKITERSRNVCINELIESDSTLGAEGLAGLSPVKCWENPQDISKIKKYLSQLRTNNPNQKYYFSDSTRQSIWSNIYYGTLFPNFVYPLQRDLINPLASNVTSLIKGQSSEFPNVKTPETFANWLNQQPLETKDVKLTFWGLGSCSDNANDSGLGFYGSAPSNSYVCKSGYVKIEDPIGTKKCYLAHVPWTGAYDTSFGTPAVQYGENQNGSNFWRYNLGQCKEVKGWFQ